MAIDQCWGGSKLTEFPHALHSIKAQELVVLSTSSVGSTQGQGYEHGLW